MIPHNVEANEKEKELHGSIAMGFFIFFKILIYFLKKKFNFKFQISSHLDACTFHGTGWGEPKPTCETLKTTHIGALPYRVTTAFAFYWLYSTWANTCSQACGYVRTYSTHEMLLNEFGL
jgi:hypothetical protein